MFVTRRRADVDETKKTFFSDFVDKYNLKNKTTIITKVCRVLSFLGLSDVGIYLRDGSFSGDTVIVNLHPSEGTHWVAYKNENYVDSYGCGRLQKQSKLL